MHKQWASKQTGFTLVELLIVIVVIAILAAISIVAYNGVQDRARTSAVHSDITNFKKKVMMFNVDNGRYPTSIADLTASGLQISGGNNYDVRTGYSNFYYCATTEGDKFALGARVAGSPAASYYISSGDGITPRSGLINLSGTCGLIDLPGTTSAEGAYSTSGMSVSGSVASWLQPSS